MALLLLTASSGGGFKCRWQISHSSGTINGTLTFGLLCKSMIWICSTEVRSNDFRRHWGNGLTVLPRTFQESTTINSIQSTNPYTFIKVDLERSSFTKSRLICSWTQRAVRSLLMCCAIRFEACGPIVLTLWGWTETKKFGSWDGVLHPYGPVSHRSPFKSPILRSIFFF